MKQIIIFILCVTLFSCATYDEKTTIEEPTYQTPNSIPKDNSYNFTILKGGSYPTIKNNTPFTPEEIEILKKSNGLEIEASVEVAHYFKYFLRDRRDILELWINNSKEYLPYIKSEFLKANLPLDLIYLPFLESGYNPMAYSRVGAGGIWQFMPRTAKSYGLQINWWIDERRSAQMATPYAIKHLKHLYNRFGDWYIALASYNAGEGRISTAIKTSGYTDYFKLIQTDHLPNETRKYVLQYLAILKIMKNLNTLGFENIDLNLPNNYKKIVIKGGRDLYQLSQAIGLGWSEFRRINPAYKRYVNNPSTSSTIYIPERLYNKTITYLKNSVPITHNGYQYYSIKSGDTWWKLSEITGKDITSLKRLNGISRNNLKVGQKLLLPKIIIKEKPKVLLASADFNTNYTIHTVKSGDTLSGISILYNIKLKAIYEMNGLNPYSILKIGQKIKLPQFTIPQSPKKIKTHKVVYGDTLSAISYKYNISIKKLMNINSIKDPSSIRIGDEIRLY